MCWRGSAKRCIWKKIFNFIRYIAKHIHIRYYTDSSTCPSSLWCQYDTSCIVEHLKSFPLYTRICFIVIVKVYAIVVTNVSLIDVLYPECIRKYIYVEKFVWSSPHSTSNPFRYYLKGVHISLTIFSNTPEGIIIAQNTAIDMAILMTSSAAICTMRT